MSMTSGKARSCMRGHFPEHKPRLMITKRNYNSSAFNGYHATPSAYSTVRCCVCGGSWRSKGEFVHFLPDAPEKWFNMSSEQLIAWFDKHPHRNHQHRKA